MKIDRFLQLFVVKEKKFYPLYQEQAGYIGQAAGLLLQLLREPDPEQQQLLYKKIKFCENEGDKITAKLYQELNRTFVTPFDREDINRLSSQMDTFLDFIHDSARRIVVYCPKSISNTLLIIGEHIELDARILGEIMDELEYIQKRPEKINEKCVHIKTIEHEVDDLYEQFMREIFAGEKDAIELVKQKNIGQALEDATDRAKDISDTLRGIIIKFA